MQTVAEKHALTAVEYFRAILNYEATPWGLKSLLPEGKVFVLDVRTPDKFEAGHIPGALNIPMADLTARLAELPKDKAIVVYCSNITCWLSAKAALQLAEKGFTVQRFFGGMEEWSKAGFPVECGHACAASAQPAASKKHSKPRR